MSEQISWKDIVNTKLNKNIYLPNSPSFISNDNGVKINNDKFIIKEKIPQSIIKKSIRSAYNNKIKK